ncbi:hypothetical protein C5S31_05620 [ANME-1 cluster archaeon GoMg2]|nr:hypothetical protein [ANME-1 cluster archaeon GoMg2]
MKAIKSIAPILPDGDLLLPEEIKEKKRLTANCRVQAVQQPRSKVFCIKLLNFRS